MLLDETKNKHIILNRFFFQIIFKKQDELMNILPKNNFICFWNNYLVNDYFFIMKCILLQTILFEKTKKINICHSQVLYLNKILKYEKTF